MIPIPFLELLAVAVSLLIVRTTAFDGCTKAAHVRCGSLCAEKCVCGLSPAVVFTGADSEGWCCGGKCRVTEETKDGEVKIVFCHGGNYQLLSKPCNNGCNYWRDDTDRGNRSYMPCDTVRQCFPEWSLCGDKPHCADISDLDMCTDQQWHGRSCPHPWQRRCEGPYPGQCIPRSKWGDGRRDCIDKSDESEYCTEERIQQQKEERERKRAKEEVAKNKNRSKREKANNSKKEKNKESNKDLNTNRIRSSTPRQKHWTLEYEEWFNGLTAYYGSRLEALIYQYVTNGSTAFVQLIHWIFLCSWNVVESMFLYVRSSFESVHSFVFETIFRPVFEAIKGPLENMGSAFRVVTNVIADVLCFAFNLVTTIVMFIFDVIYFLVWIVGFCSSFVVFKLPVKLKNGFFTSLDLFELAWSVSWELFYKASNSSLWFVNTWLPKVWEEHFWEVIKASISFFTLVYTLVRDDRL